MTREISHGQHAEAPEGTQAVSEPEQQTNLFDEERLAQPRIQSSATHRFPTVPYLGPVAPPPVEPPPGPDVRNYAGKMLVAAVIVVLLIAAIAVVQGL